MRITFISPHYPNIWEALGIGYIASYCNLVLGDSVKIEFLSGNFEKEDTIIERAAKSNIIGIGLTSPVFKKGIELCIKIKDINPKIKIVLGGWHVTGLGLDNLAKIYDKISFIDTIILGEGEEAFSHVIENNLSGIFIHDTKLDFFDLPWPNRELIDQGRMLDLCQSICGERIASFQSRRGCSHNCSICAESSMTGIYDKKNNPIRVRNPYDLLSEIEYVNKTYSIDRFKFVDATWCYPKEAVVDFCELKIKKKNKIRWEAMAHAAYLDKDLLKLMKEADCIQLNIGCESGSQEILNDIRKGVTIEKLKKVFKWGREIGIDMRAFFILGTPLESKESVEQTRQLALEIQANIVGFTILCPFPGSDYYSPKYTEDMFDGSGEYDNDFWRTDNFSNLELREIKKEFNEGFKDTLVPHQKK